jgi:hypothetical protein
VPQAVINTIAPARIFSRSAISAWLGHYFVQNKEPINVALVALALVDPPVGVSQKDGAALVGTIPPALAGNTFGALLRGVFGPSVRSVVAPALSVGMASAAFVCEATRPRRIPHEYIGGGWQFLFAATAKTMMWFSGVLQHSGHEKQYQMRQLFSRDATPQRKH